MPDGRHELRDVEQTTPTYPSIVTIRAPREFHHDDGSTYRGATGADGTQYGRAITCVDPTSANP